MSIPSDNSSYVVPKTPDLESSQYPKLTNTQRKRRESQERIYLTSILMWFLINFGYKFDLRPVLKQSNYVNSVVVEKIVWGNKQTGEENIVFEFEKLMNSLRMSGVKEQDLLRKAAVEMNNILIDLCSYAGLYCETRDLRKGEESKKVTRKIVTGMKIMLNGECLYSDRDTIFTQGKWFYETYLNQINKSGESFPNEEVKDWMKSMEQPVPN